MTRAEIVAYYGVKNSVSNFMVLGMNEELFRTAPVTLPGFRELTRFNHVIVQRLIAKMAWSNVNTGAYLSAQLSGDIEGPTLTLTEPDTRIIEIAHAYWNAAGGPMRAGPFAGQARGGIVSKNGNTLEQTAVSQAEVGP